MSALTHVLRNIVFLVTVMISILARSVGWGVMNAEATASPETS